MSDDRAELTALAELLGDLARRLGSDHVTQDVDDRESSTGAGSPGPDGLTTVRVANELLVAAGAALRLSVELARAAGRTWQELGDVLGVSRQAAFQRFGHPIDPRTGAPMRDAMLPGAAAKATQLMIDWLDERYDQVTADFTDKMIEVLPVSKLTAAWAQIIGMVGRYEGMGEALSRQAGDLTIVEIPLKFEAGEMKGRVVYDAGGKVAGLFILEPDAL